MAHRLALLVILLAGVLSFTRASLSRPLEDVNLLPQVSEFHADVTMPVPQLNVDLRLGTVQLSLEHRTNILNFSVQLLARWDAASTALREEARGGAVTEDSPSFKESTSQPQPGDPFLFLPGYGRLVLPCMRRWQLVEAPSGQASWERHHNEAGSSKHEDSKLHYVLQRADSGRKTLSGGLPEEEHHVDSRTNQVPVGQRVCNGSMELTMSMEPHRHALIRGRRNLQVFLQLIAGTTAHQ